MHRKPFCLILLVTITLLFSCKKDEGRSCVTCNSPQTTAFEVCEESDGTASVNGENTGTAYEVYIAGLEAVGASCSG